MINKKELLFSSSFMSLYAFHGFIHIQIHHDVTVNIWKVYKVFNINVYV